MNEDRLPESEFTQPSDQPPPLSPQTASSYVADLKSQQNLPLASLAAALAAIIGATVWAVVTVLTGYQIGWMAIGVGCLVGLAVRYAGKGLTNTFGVVGALFALLGCLLGNLITACELLAKEGIVSSSMQALTSALLHPAVALDLLKIMFSPMDLLFYALAIYAGFKFSFRQLTKDQEAALGALQ